jgi:hypothetical protein
VAETSIKITLDVADKAAQKAFENFVTSATKSDKALDHLRETGAEAFSEIGVHIGKATGLYDIFVGNLAANLAIKSFELLEEAAHKLFDLFVVDGVRAAIAQENAVNSLNVALANSGKYSKATSDEFVEFAEQLQKTSKFSNDAIIQNAALIQSLGHLDEDGLKRATQAAVDLAAGLGRDLPEASELVAKAAAGNVTALGKLGIAIQAGNTHAETFSRALRAIEERFSGSAAAQVNTYSGAVTQAANSFEDLTKQVGDLIVKNPVFVETIKAANQIFQEWTGAITSQHQALAILVGSGLVTFLETMAFVVSIVDVAARVFQTIYGVVQALSIPFLAVTVPIRALSVGLKQATEEMVQFGQSAQNNLSALSSGGDGALAKAAQDLLALRDAANQGLGAVASGATGAVEPLTNAKGKISELTEEMKRHQENLKSFSDALLKQAESSKSSYEAQVTFAKDSAEKQIAIAQAAVDKRQDANLGFLEKKREIETQYYNAQKQSDFDKFVKDNLELTEARAAGVIHSETELNAARTQLETNFNNTRQKEDDQYQISTIKNEREINEAKKKLREAEIGAFADGLGQLSSLMHTNSRELFEIGKVAAIAQATINTYEAATKAYAQWGYPWGIAAAAAVSIAGAVQISNIEAQSPSFETGGIVPGSSFTGDNVMANVNSGEMILTRGQQAQLFSLANGASSDGSNTESLLASINTKLGALLKKDTTVIVGGKTITDTLRSELASGRSF